MKVFYYSGFVNNDMQRGIICLQNEGYWLIKRFIPLTGPPAATWCHAKKRKLEKRKKPISRISY
jgi:hypothetical protein